MPSDGLSGNYMIFQLTGIIIANTCSYSWGLTKNLVHVWYPGLCSAPWLLCEWSHKKWALFPSWLFWLLSAYQHNIEHVWRWRCTQKHAHTGSSVSQIQVIAVVILLQQAVKGWLIDGRNTSSFKRKKTILDFPPIPTYYEIVMPIAVTLLSPPFLSVCLRQHLLWTALKRGVGD